MFLKQVTEVVPIRSQDVIIGTSFNTPAGAGVVPVSRELVWQPEISRSNPIEKLKLIVTFRLAVASSTVNPDGYAGIVKNIIFNRNGVGASVGGSVPRGTLQVVNARGVDVLNHRCQIANVDRGTFNLPAAPTVATNYTIAYDIDLADDRLDDPLRAHTLCPVHVDTANPTLRVQFASQAELDINAAPAVTMTLLQAELHIFRRNMPTERTAEIINAGGFIEVDMVSREYANLPTGPQRVTIESPGEYESLQLTQYNGAGAAQVKLEVSDTNQRLWRIRQQNNTVREFTFPGLISVNEESKVHGGVQPVFHNVTALCDFVSDQAGVPDNNLGSLLDTNLDAQNGQQTTLEWNIASTASTPRVVLFSRRILSPVGARRFSFA